MKKEVNVEDVRLRVERHAGPGVITAVGPLMASFSAGERLFKDGPGMVKRVISIMMRSYPPNNNGKGDYGAAGSLTGVILLIANNPNLDDDRLVEAIKSFGSSSALNLAAGNLRNGNGAGAVSVALAKRYNGSDTRFNYENSSLRPLTDEKKKLVGTVTDYSKIQRKIGGVGDETDTFPWMRADSDYRVTLTRGPISDLELPAYQRDPSDRKSYLLKQGPWLHALEGVLDVVKRDDGSLMVMDGGGRVYKKKIIEGDPDYVMDYRLHENVGGELSEHALFEKLNGTRRAVRAIEMFLGHDAIGGEPERTIQKILNEFALADYQNYEEESEVAALSAAALLSASGSAPEADSMLSSSMT